MIDLKLDFSENGVVLDANNIVDNVNSTAQEALVNTSVKLGEDSVYTDRGTELFKRSTQVSAFSTQEAKHAANFASSETLVFIQRTNGLDPDLLAEYNLQLVDIQNKKINFNAFVETIQNETLGISQTVANI